MVIFHSYVRLPEGISKQNQVEIAIWIAIRVWISLKTQLLIGQRGSATSCSGLFLDEPKILLCIQGSKKTQGSKLGPADESRASLAHVLFLAHTQNHPSKDLSGQTNQ